MKKTAKKTKTAFVLSQPESMSDEDVIEAGKKAGVQLDKKAVYRIRWMASAKKKGKKKKFTPKAIKVVRTIDGRSLDTAPGKKKQKGAPEPDLLSMTVAVPGLQEAIRKMVREEIKRTFGSL